MTKKPVRPRAPQTFIILPLLIAGLFPMFSIQPLKADPMWVFAVQISATVQTTPPRINLTWMPDTNYTASGYLVSRKTKEATSWTPLITLSGSTTNFTDTNVSVGSNYEYSIMKPFIAGTNNYYGDGYIFSGIQAPLNENRGKLILLVETSITPNLTTELARLQADLAGDGWQVIVHSVSSNDTPAYAKSLIVADYNADPANVKAVFLFGHIPIFMSGNLNYDGHFARPMPADSYYGDMDGDWSSLPGFLPSDAELEVGRVDFFDMPGVGAPSPWPSETEMLRNYLNKDHNWRFGLIKVQRRALMADRFGFGDGETRASTGYRNFETFLGHNKIAQADVSDSAAPANRWLSMITAGSYLWTYACGGGGDYNSISDMGTNAADYHNVYSTDIVAQDPKCVFFMLEGSHFGNWEKEDNLLRSVLAQPTMGLAVCCIAGHPHWYVHHMGLGETIGYGTRLTMNNLTLYPSMSNGFPRAIYIALMGDPSLRLEPLAPPSGLTAAAGAKNVALHWSASTDSVAGYHVYRAATPSGPFTRLTGSLVTGTSFTDTTPPAGDATYMVRAVALQTNPSGSYFNPSQGIFISTGNTNPPPICTYALSASSVTLSAAAGTGSVQVITRSDCAWTATSNDPWITITSGASGTGNGTISFLVSSNSGSVARTGSLGGTAGTFSINQNANTNTPPACTYALSATSVSMTAFAGTGTVQIITGSNCPWSATSNDPWVTITSGASGTGNGSIRYMVMSNSDSVARTGTLSTTAGTFSITQDASGSGNPTNSIDEIKGTYTGLFYDPASIALESSGSFSATIGKNGRASVRLEVGGKSYSFTTVFDTSGAATATVRHGHTVVLETDLQIGPLGSDLVEGTVSDGTWTAALVANRSVFSPEHPCPNAGKYTITIPGDTSTPGQSLGDGYATATVNSKGSVTASGSLADGTPFTSAATVAGNGQWPLYDSLYARAGMIIGWLTFTNSQTEDLTGEITWIKPAMPKAKTHPGGLTLTTEVSGSHYIPPAPRHAIFNFTNALLVLNTGNPGDTVTNQVTIGANNQVTNVSTGRRILSFSSSNGSFKGELPSMPGKTSFSGVVLQTQRFGAGYFLIKTNQTSGEVLIIPAQ